MHGAATKDLVQGQENTRKRFVRIRHSDAGWPLLKLNRVYLMYLQVA